MITPRVRVRSVSLLVVLSTFFVLSPSNAHPAANTVPVRITVTASVPSDKAIPEISQDQIVVKRGKDRLHVTGWVPAKGDQAGLGLFILIDDACASSLGSQLDDIRSFINDQPPSTSVGVGYARNSTVQIAQNFTTDHAQAAAAVRLPLGNVGAYGSIYLSAIDLMKRWPAHPDRREVILISDGIDRARGGPRSRLSINPDVLSARDVAQRTGTIVDSIYAPGVGVYGRNYFERSNGLNGISQLSDETGGQSFFIGYQQPVSLKPYFDDLRKALGNQYLLTFLATPGTKAGLQYVSIDSEVSGVDFSAADGVWVPAAK